jgi:hypothetical protein
VAEETAARPERSGSFPKTPGRCNAKKISPAKPPEAALKENFSPEESGIEEQARRNHIEPALRQGNAARSPRFLIPEHRRRKTLR